MNNMDIEEKIDYLENCKIEFENWGLHSNNMKQRLSFICDTLKEMLIQANRKPVLKIDNLTNEQIEQLKSF